MCLETEALVRALVDAHEIAATIETIDDFQKSIELSVFAPPAVMIDQVVRTVGRVPESDELLGWLKQTIPEVEKTIFPEKSSAKE